jgi:hypothetical protein
MTDTGLLAEGAATVKSFDGNAVIGYVYTESTPAGTLQRWLLFCKPGNQFQIPAPITMHKATPVSEWLNFVRDKATKSSGYVRYVRALSRVYDATVLGSPPKASSLPAPVFPEPIPTTTVRPGPVAMGSLPASADPHPAAPAPAGSSMHLFVDNGGNPPPPPTGGSTGGTLPQLDPTGAIVLSQGAYLGYAISAGGLNDPLSAEYWLLPQPFAPAGFSKSCVISPYGAVTMAKSVKTLDDFLLLKDVTQLLSAGGRIAITGCNNYDASTQPEKII